MGFQASIITTVIMNESFFGNIAFLYTKKGFQLGSIQNEKAVFVRFFTDRNTLILYEQKKSILMECTHDERTRGEQWEPLIWGYFMKNITHDNDINTSIVFSGKKFII